MGESKMWSYFKESEWVLGQQDQFLISLKLFIFQRQTVFSLRWSGSSTEARKVAEVKVGSSSQVLFRAGARPADG